MGAMEWNAGVQGEEAPEAGERAPESFDPHAPSLISAGAAASPAENPGPQGARSSMAPGFTPPVEAGFLRQDGPGLPVGIDPREDVEWPVPTQLDCSKAWKKWFTLDYKEGRQWEEKGNCIPNGTAAPWLMVFPGKDPPLRIFYMAYDATVKEDVLHSSHSDCNQNLGINWHEDGPVLWDGGSPVKNAEAAVIYRADGSILCLFENVRDPKHWKPGGLTHRTTNPMSLEVAYYQGVNQKGNVIFSRNETPGGSPQMSQIVSNMFPAEWDHGYITVPHATDLSNGKWRIYYVGALCENEPKVRSQISLDEGKTWTWERKTYKYTWKGTLWPGLEFTGLDPCVVNLTGDPNGNSFRMYTKIGTTEIGFRDSWDGLSWTVDPQHSSWEAVKPTPPWGRVRQKGDRIEDPVVVKLPSGRVLMYYQRMGQIRYAESD